MEILDFLYLLKKKYDKSHKKFLFISDNRKKNETNTGLCYCIYRTALFDGHPRITSTFIEVVIRLLYRYYLERGGKEKYTSYWFPRGELKGRRKLINYAIKKLKKDKMG